MNHSAQTNPLTAPDNRMSGGAQDLLRLQRDLAVALLSQETLDGALNTLLDHICRLPGVDSGGVYRVDGTTGRADLLAHRGLSAPFVDIIAHVEPDNFRARQLLDGQPMYMGGDALTAADMDGVLALEGLRALAVIPQLFKGRVVAALNLGSHTADDFAPATRAAIESIAALMGGTIVHLDAQREILHAKEDWERTFDAVPDLIALLDADHRITRVNRAMAAQLGCTPAQAVGRHCFDAVHGLSAPPDFCPHRQMLGSGKQEHAEIEEARLGGFFDVTVTPLRNETGSINGSVHIAHDITKRRQSLLALRASEENFRNLAEGALDGIVILAPDERNVYANRRTAEITGYGQEELMRLGLPDIVYPGELENLRARLRDRLAGRTAPSHFETVFRRKEGATYPVEVSASRIIWQNQAMVLGFFRDITARKQMANEILQVGDWEKMRIGQDLHDTLGQQLAGIAYLSQALARGECTRFGGALDKGMNQLVMETRHAMELVRQVVRGLTPIAPEPNGLASALQNVAESARRRHGTTCDLQVDAGLTMTDRQMSTHLFFIAQEAVTNALRHGQVRHILIRLARREAQAELTILDDGIGLPVGLPAGPGMGLRIMQHRADLIGGTLVVERGESGGTRVSCRFRQTG